MLDLEACDYSVIIFFLAVAHRLLNTGMLIMVFMNRFESLSNEDARV